MMQSFFGRGKLLLTSEYFILDGAEALALPTSFGQRLEVETCTREHDNSTLHWVGRNSDHEIWIDVLFDLKDFDIISSRFGNHEDVQSILRQARIENPLFLTEDCDLMVSTELEFSNDWGLGSSSTLIYMIAKWADICPFELSDKTFGGSGYDIACAGAKSPLIYQRISDAPHMHMVEFEPDFVDHLYFIHQNQKQNSRSGIQHYRQANPEKEKNIERLNYLTQEILNAKTLTVFEVIIKEHENLIGHAINQTPIQQACFSDYWGAIKSLGAWGGDFMLATSDKSEDETLAYFKDRGYQKILKYRDMIYKEGK